MRDRREEEEEKAEELKMLEFKRRKLEARAQVGPGVSDVNPEVDGQNDQRLVVGGKALEELRRRLELEKTEVLRKMSSQKDKSNSEKLQSSLSESSQRTAQSTVYTLTREIETNGRLIGSEEGAFFF